MNNHTSQRIAILRFTMIFGVVVLHTPLYVPIAEIGTDAFSQIKAFFQLAFFRGAVPVLTFISGYLLFQSNLDTKPLKLYAKKARVLLLPFLVFNLGLLAFVLATGIASVKASNTKEWLDVAFGLYGKPINYPLNFLRDMMALMLIAPLLGGLLRENSFIGLAGTIVFFLLDYDGKFILRNDMPVIFYLGAMASFHKWDMQRLDKLALPCLAAFVGLCAAFIHYRMTNNNVLRFAAPLLLWPAASLLQGNVIGKALERMSKYSFFVFLSHAPVLALLWDGYQRMHEPVPYPVFWVVAPVITTAFLIGVYEGLMHVCPSLFRAVLGLSVERNKNSKNPVVFVE